MLFEWNVCVCINVCMYVHVCDRGTSINAGGLFSLSPDLLNESSLFQTPL